MPVQTLPAPAVVRSYFDDGFDPHLPAVCLRWGDEEAETPQRLWELPEGVSVCGPAPRQFGLSVRRLRADSYHVRVLWDRSHFVWPALGRLQLLGSSLAPLLAALGNDLWHLLDQPVRGQELARKAA
jgi:hypothetical protein